MRLVVVRHGVTDWNVTGRMQGRTDIPLNAEGRRQAEAVGRRLASEPIARILSSPMSRALGTALPIASAHGLVPEVREDLHEAHMGLWEGLTWEEVAAQYSHQLAERDRVGPGYKGHEGESVLEVAARAADLLMRIRDLPGTTCVVTHASPARHLIAALTGEREHWKLRLRNVSVSILEDARLLCLDDVSHLEVSPGVSEAFRHLG